VLRDNSAGAEKSDNSAALSTAGGRWCNFLTLGFLALCRVSLGLLDKRQNTGIKQSTQLCRPQMPSSDSA
jgi:hypothetical protein